MGVVIEAAGGNANQIKHLNCARPQFGFGRAGGMGADGVQYLIRHPHHRVQRVHGGLEDKADLIPAVFAQAFGAEIQDLLTLEADAAA